MRIATTVGELRAVRKDLAGPVGLVPTMGYLHEGHLSLVRAARAECASVIVSIFVNPAQFAEGEDLSTYPRDPDRDVRLLRHEGVDVVFVPSVEEMYPPGSEATVDPGRIGEVLEGAARPGHFRGVATVVVKLFNVSQPERAYFGEKDAQQVVVLESVARSLHIPEAIKTCPTVRAPDGLALSSRNVRLTSAERRAAPAIYTALRMAREQWLGGERCAEVLRATVRDRIGQRPELSTEYVSVAHPRTLAELDVIDPEGALVSVAVRAGDARLIDNIRLDATGREGES